MKSSSEALAIGALAIAAAAAAAGGCRDRGASAHATAADREDPTRCAGCHMPEFLNTTHPPHEGARPTTCGVCHTQRSWHPFRVEHPWWALTGGHLRAAEDRKLAGKENQVKCFWCHRGDPATWKDTKKACVACHEEDRDAVTRPDHSRLSTACETCHSTDAWKPATRPAPVEEPAAPSAAPSASHAPAPRPTATAHATPAPTHAAPAPTHAPTHTAPTHTAPAPTAPPTPRPDVTSHASRRR